MHNFVKEVVLRLTEAQAEFVIVGGISAVLQGVPILTQDLDVCYRRSPANLPRIVTALGPLDPRPRGFPPELPFTFDERTLQLGTNFTLAVGDESLDLLGEMSAIGGYDQIIANTLEMEVAGVRVRVLPLAQLIASKEAAGRAKDLAVLPVLRAALQLQQGQEPPSNDPTR